MSAGITTRMVRMASLSLMAIVIADASSGHASGHTSKQNAGSAQGNSAATLPALAPTPSIATVPRVVSLQPVSLSETYATDFRKEHPQIASGWLLVIRADVAVLAPRAVAEPLLIASGEDWVESVEWFNHGSASGHRVCFIPSPVQEQGSPARTLNGLRVWFGTPQLPESVDGAVLKSEAVLANRIGIEAIPVEQVQAAIASSSRVVRIDNRDALVEMARTMIARWSPDEVTGIAVPTAPATPPTPAQPLK